MLGEVLLDLGGLRLQRTKDRSSTELELELRVDHVDGLAWVDARGARDLAGALMAWLAEYRHQLPDLPAVEEDLEMLDWDDEPVPDRFGQLELRHDAAGAVTIMQADPWVLMARTLWDQLATGQVARTGVTMTADLLTVRDSRGATVTYWRRAPAEQPGTWVLQRVNWQPATVHVIPEHTRARSEARWPDCATGWHDRCGAPDRCGCPCHSSGQR